MQINARILNRFDSAANWVSENPTLASGEFGVQSDGYFKIGDGATAWNDLDYAGGAADFSSCFLTDGSRELAGHLLPEMTGASGVVSARDIGSSTQKIRRLYVHDAYIDAGSLYVNNKLVLQDDSGTITVSTDEDQDLKIKTTGTGDVIFESENEVNSVAKGGIEFTVPSDNPTKYMNFTNQSVGGNITFSAVGTSAQVQFTATEQVDITAPNIDINGDADVSGEITFGTLHHHNLTGLTDDDHTQYVKADGTRAFTGKVTGVTPTETNQLATKSYVDSVVQGLDWQESVLAMTNNAGASQTLGYRYISTETSGDWTINYIYEWNGASWDETVANEGIAAWVENEDVLYTFNGSSWVKFGSTITHENLNGVNDGTYRHLTASQVTELTTSGTCTIHTHVTNRSGVGVRLTSNQTIPNSTTTKLNLNTVDWDTLGEWDSVNYRFVALESGKYLATFIGSIVLIDTSLISVYIKVNGSTLAHARQITGSDGQTMLPVSTILDLDVDDYVEFFVYQNTGTDQTAYSDSNYNIAQIQKIG